MRSLVKIINYYQQKLLTIINLGANKGIIEKWDLWSKTIGNAESGFGPDPNPDQTEKSQKFKNKHFIWI